MSTAIVGEEGIPLIVNNELGPDQEDVLTNFMDEASREVLKSFVSRQGNVSGIPFQKTATDVTYRFKEETPLLPQALALKETLTEDVKNALFLYVTFLWLKIKKNNDQAQFFYDRYQKTINDITGCIYLLHD